MAAVYVVRVVITCGYNLHNIRMAAKNFGWPLDGHVPTYDSS